MGAEIVPFRDAGVEPRARPNNVEAEATLLGALLSENRAFDVVADILKPSDFFVPAHALIYEIALGEVMSGRTVTPVTIKGKLENDPGLAELGGPRYLAHLTGGGSWQGLLAPAEIARTIADLARRREMLERLTAASEACFDESADLRDITEVIERALESPGSTTARISSAADALGSLIDSFDKPRRGTTCGQIKPVDELLGRMEPSQMIVAAGRPGMGKSAFGGSYALGAAKQGHGVLFVSLEMDREQIIGRMAADMCFEPHMIPYAAIRDGNVSREDRERLIEAQKRIAELPLVIADEAEMSTGALHAMVRSQKRRFEASGQKLELVIVDYLQLLRPSIKTNGRYEAVSEVSRALKAIAKDQGVALLALAQLSRATETRNDKRPQLSDLRDSGQIEQDADAVMFLHREEYYLGQARPMEHSPKFDEWEAGMEAVRGRMEFILAKRRNGITGVSVGAFFSAYQAMRG